MQVGITSAVVVRQPRMTPMTFDYQNNKQNILLSPQGSGAHIIYINAKKMHYFFYMMDVGWP